jgi:branched-chain amino acid aminotransferase
MTVFWIDGQWVPKEDAAIHPCDHGLLYGDGVCSGWRCANGQVLLVEEHLENLFAAAAEQRLTIPYSRAELRSALIDTIAANHRRQGYGCLVVTRGAGGFGPDPRKLDPRVLIWVEDYWPFPPELISYGLHAISVAIPYYDPRLLGNPYLVRAKTEALQQGCLEAILHDPAGQLLGTTEGGLFYRCGEQWVLPQHQKLDPHAHRLYQWMIGAGWSVQLSNPTFEQLHQADEIFLVGASAGVVPVIRINHQPVGTEEVGEATRQARLWWEQLAGLR